MKKYTASLYYATVSYQKMGLIVKMIRGKSVKDALVLLSFLPKKSARILCKVVASAQANALSKEGKHTELFVSGVDVGRGPKIKRMRFTSRARVYGYVKHRSFVRVILSVK